ncbi:MAG: Hpt domain-containing protein [Candidatus Wallbacteria bacterium]
MSRSNSIFNSSEDAPRELMIFDYELLKLHADNDPELMKYMVQLFIDCVNTSDYISKIKESIDNRNGKQLELFAHKLKGTALNACATAIGGLLTKLERAGYENKFNETAALFNSVLDEISKYKSEIQKLFN